MKKNLFLFLVVLLLLLAPLTACDFFLERQQEDESLLLVEKENFDLVDEKTTLSLEEVVLYISQEGRLPESFLTKKQAQELGWVAAQGNLWELAPGKSIGGDRFYNREGLLPEKEGRLYYECDIDYSGGRRGAKRLVYSNDGLFFYTDDHYKTFREIIVE